MPSERELPGPLDAVLTANHPLFTTGHTAPAVPALTKSDIAERALDLARVLHELMSGEREVQGLLALLLVNYRPGPSVRPWTGGCRCRRSRTVQLGAGDHRGGARASCGGGQGHRR